MGVSVVSALAIDICHAALEGFIAFVLFAYYRNWRRTYIRRWAWAWLAMGLHTLGYIAALRTVTLPPEHGLRIVASLLYSSAGYLGAAWFLLGTWELGLEREVTSRTLRRVTLAIGLVSAALVLGTIPLEPRTRYFLRIGVRLVLMGGAYLAVGAALLRLSSWQRGVGRRVVLSLFFLFGLQQFHYLGIQVVWLLLGKGPPDYFPLLPAVDMVLTAFMGMGAVLWVTDIERGRADAATASLKESESRLAAAFQNLPFGFWTCDADGRIVLQNATCHELWGAALGKRAAELDLPPEFVEVLEAVNRRALAGEVVREESVQDLGCGDQHMFLVVSPIQRDSVAGGVRGAIGVSLDITDLREAEAARRELAEQLERTQRLETVGQLAAGVAHDFNNLLQVILGHVDTLHAENPSEATAAVLQAATRAGALTGQLLAYGRQQRLAKQRTELNAMVKGLLGAVRRVVHEDIDVVFHPGAERPTVEVDRDQLEKVVLHLCVNARDAMPEGGTLTLETGELRVGPEDSSPNRRLKPGRYARLTVSDTGIGMAPEVRERVFEPFFSTKDAASGAGLGLAMVFGVVNQHDGMVQVASEPGEGTRFDILLPGLEPSVRSPERRSAPRPARGDETVMIVEDDPAVRGLGKVVLERAGYRVLAAADGAEALVSLEESEDPVHLMLIDVIMPRMSGRELFEQLEVRRPEIPVLFTSGYSTRTLPENYLREKGLTLIAKPYRPDTLLRAVRDVLDH